MRQKVIITINAPLILKMRDINIKCGIRDGEIVEGNIEEGGCEETFLCLSLTGKTCRFRVPPAVPLLNYISCGILWRIFCQTGIFAGFSLYIKLTIN
jgi:hypothetical protein